MKLQNFKGSIADEEALGKFLEALDENLNVCQRVDVGKHGSSVVLAPPDSIVSLSAAAAVDEREKSPLKSKDELKQRVKSFKSSSFPLELDLQVETVPWHCFAMLFWLVIWLVT